MPPLESTASTLKLKQSATQWLVQAKRLLEGHHETTLETPQNIQLTNGQIETLVGSMRDNNIIKVLRFRNGAFKSPDSGMRILLLGLGSLIQSLQVLDLSRNGISALPDEWVHLLGIRELNFSRNSLADLPCPSSLRNANVALLDLSSNRLKHVPEVIRQLPSLVRVVLRSNRIAALPAFFLNMTALRELVIFDNPIKTIPKELLALTDDPEKCGTATKAIVDLMRIRGAQREYLALGNTTVKKPLDKRVLKIESLEPKEVAIQLCIADHAAFAAIPIREMLQKRFSEKHRSPKWTAAVMQWNRWVQWPPTEITRHTKSLAKRTEALTRFIRIAEHCAEFRNFNAAYAIISGLTQPPVARLKQTWANLSRKIAVKFETLQALFDINQNHKNYREALSVASAPLVPYLGLFSKDLTALEDGMEMYVDARKQINVNKFRLIFDTVKRFAKYQEITYRFPIDPAIMEYLETYLPIPEADAFAASLVCEPRQKPT